MIPSSSTSISGKGSQTTESICEKHKEPYKYYCKSEQRYVCQECVVVLCSEAKHDRITLEKVAMNKSAGSIDELLRNSADTTRNHAENITKRSECIQRFVNNCDECLTKFDEDVILIANMKSELDNHSKIAKQHLLSVKDDYITRLEQVVKNHEDEIDRMKIAKEVELEKRKDEIESAAICVQTAKEEATSALDSDSNVRLITSAATQEQELKKQSQLHFTQADRALGYFKFVAGLPPPMPSIGQLVSGEQWKPAGKFSTGNFSELQGIAINQNRDIAVTSNEDGVMVFTMSTLAEVKNSFTVKDSPSQVWSVAVSPQNRYIIDGQESIMIFDSEGKKLSDIPVVDANSVAIDAEGRIVVGQASNTISIYHPDGSFDRKFPTLWKPLRLAITSNLEIVCTVCDHESDENRSIHMIQLMDYYGGNIRVIPSPADVKVWHPDYVCCGRQGEIFAVNDALGDPTLSVSHMCANRNLRDEVIGIEAKILQKCEFQFRHFLIPRHQNIFVKIPKRFHRS